jgi:hypothetical protein
MRVRACVRARACVCVRVRVRVCVRFVQSCAFAGWEGWSGEVVMCAFPALSNS